jgi:hypothetical protein
MCSLSATLPWTNSGQTLATISDVSKPVDRPGGAPAPDAVTLGGERVLLGPLAAEVADRYFAEFPEDLERYGEAARPWELHDTAYCLQWAVLDVEGLDSVTRQVAWLRDVLEARDFPLEHLARNLEICADVVAGALGERGAPVAERLRAGAMTARGR